jgi:hypothetical protein
VIIPNRPSGVGVGARGVVNAPVQTRVYKGPVTFPTQPRETPDIRLSGLPGGPSFGYRDRAGEGVVSPVSPDRIPRLFYPNFRTNLAGRSQFSMEQTASHVWLPPVEVPFRGGMVSSVRNRNVLRPSASASFVPAVFIAPPSRR